MYLTSVQLFCILVGSGILPTFDPVAAADGNLAKKYEEFSKLLSRSAVIDMSSSSFEKFVLKQPKNYTVFAMLTATAPQYQCHRCRSLYTEFELVAKSYQRAYSKRPILFFVSLDVDRGREIFEKLKIRTVPHVAEFPRDKGYPTEIYDMKRSSAEAENIANWIYKRTQIKLNIVRPFDYVTPALTGCAILAILILCAWFRKHLVFFVARSFWCLVVLAIIYVFMSGQMWNKIRNPPWFHGTPEGQTTIIFPSRQMQLKSETVIVAGIYACFAAGMLLMNFAVEAKLRRRYKIFMSFCGLLAVVFFYSLLLSVFRTKQKGYPYRCLFA